MIEPLASRYPPYVVADSMYGTLARHIVLALLTAPEYNDE